jgi:predicted nucleic acid-binding protein
MSVFLDTNVLLYSVGTIAEEQSKREQAWALLERVDVVLSVQVLQEFYVQATRASRVDRLNHERAADFIAAWRRFSIQDNTIDTLLAALAIKERYGFSYWDSAVVAAARVAGCSELYTEDLSHGQIVDGVRIINPFQPS